MQEKNISFRERVKKQLLLPFNVYFLTGTL